MAKTKTELEADSDRHQELMAEARAKLQRGELSQAIQAAVSAWPYVDGMMQYDRRWGSKSEFETVDSIALVLRYAPLLFDFDSLEKLSALLKSQRRIDKNAAADIGADLDVAKATMWDAHRLWALLQSEGEIRQDTLRQRFGGDQDRWRWISETWDRIGLVRRTPESGSYRLSIVTRLDSRIRGKCSSCGAVGQAPRIQLLQAISCPKCKRSGFFVLLAE
jgi:hypothetical protein